MPALKLDHITLLVTCLARSMPYYNALLPLLGFNKEQEHIWHNGNGFYFQFRAASEETRPYERYGAGMNHLGFSAPDVATVHQVHRNMEAAGFEVPAIQNLGGATSLFMKDPDGIRFEVTHYLPGMAVVD